MADLGNAVDAKWVGPSGFQLYDGTALNPGDIVRSVGFDETKDNPYWEQVKKLGKDDVPVADATASRDDWSFDTEAGGGSTGRPGAPADPVEEPPTQLDVTTHDGSGV